MALPNGLSPASGALTLRVPPGDLSLTFTYGEDGSRRHRLRRLVLGNGRLGLIRDPTTNRRQAVWALIIVRAHSSVLRPYVARGSPLMDSGPGRGGALRRARRFTR